MSSLFGTMSVAVAALEAQQAGLQTTTNNLANMNTPGYTRERPILEEADPVWRNGIAYGQGVELEGIQSLQDQLLELQIGEETQQQSSSQAYVNAMSQVQTLLPDDTSGIGQAISAFFQSLNQLSTNPSDTSLRSGVLSAANDMSASFNNVASKLTDIRTGLDQNVVQDVNTVNSLTAQIAALNGQLAQMPGTSGEAGTCVDQRNNLIQQLSGYIDVSVMTEGNCVTLTTKQGASLVVGSQSYALATQLGNDNVQHVLSQGQDITAGISSGELGGILQARDSTIPTLQTSLDSLAAGLCDALNTAQEGGFDLNGNAGQALFSTAGSSGAAASMKVAIQDSNLIAASSDGSAGSNGNLNQLAAVAKQAVSAGMTATQAYANLVFVAGTAVDNGTAELNASSTMLQQLQQQSTSVSGVSLDEEASNILLYQRAYEASARAISAVDEMLQIAINMGAAS